MGFIITEVFIVSTLIAITLFYVLIAWYIGVNPDFGIWLINKLEEIAEKQEEKKNDTKR